MNLSVLENSFLQLILTDYSHLLVEKHKISEPGYLVLIYGWVHKISAQINDEFLEKLWSGNRADTLLISFFRFPYFQSIFYQAILVINENFE